MTGSSRSFLIATRASPEVKARFVALANARSMSESALLMQLIETVLSSNRCDEAPASLEASSAVSSCERITLRLRPMDRHLLAQRAASRRMKPATYLVSLARAHLRCARPLPICELNELKAAVARIGALERQLHAMLLGDALHLASADIALALQQAIAEVRDVRRLVSDIVQTNLMSWEADDA